MRMAAIAPYTQAAPQLTEAYQAASYALSIYNQQRLANENLKRARQGLPPLRYYDVPGMVPTFQLTGGLDPNASRVAWFALAIAGAGLLLLLNRTKG